MRKLIIVFAAAAAASQQPAPKLKITLEMIPPIWVEGEALRFRMIVDNLGGEAAEIPAEWSSGRGCVFRQARAVDGAEIIAKAAQAPESRGSDNYKIPSGARLVMPIAIANPDPPPGDAFDLLFLSEKPAAGSEALRVERVENLRGARARVETEKGAIVMELAPEAAPLAVRNFVKLAEIGFFDGQAFHRIAKSLCIQAGDPGSKAADITKLAGAGGSTHNGRPLPLERTRALFERGAVGIARRVDPLYQQIRAALADYYKVDTVEQLDAKLRTEWPAALALAENPAALASGSSQFFICTTSVPHFTGMYSAIAKVVEGLDVADAIEAGAVAGAAAENADLAERPVAPVRIRKVTIERRAGSYRGPGDGTFPARK